MRTLDPGGSCWPPDYFWRYFICHLSNPLDFYIFDVRKTSGTKYANSRQFRQNREVFLVACLFVSSVQPCPPYKSVERPSCPVTSYKLARFKRLKCVFFHCCIPVFISDRYLSICWRRCWNWILRKEFDLPTCCDILSSPSRISHNFIIAEGKITSWITFKTGKNWVIWTIKFWTLKFRIKVKSK